jgi:cytoskeleton protein RodZ
MSDVEKTDDLAQSADRLNETVKDGKHDLKSIREARGITLHDIFRVSRVSVVNLDAIEKANYHLLPTPFIAKSFIKIYAKAIGVDADTIIHQYEIFLKTRDNIPVEEKIEEPPKDRRKQTRIIVLSLLAIAVICIFVYLIYSFYPILNEWSSMRSVKTSSQPSETIPPANPQNAPAETDTVPPAQPVQPVQSLPALQPPVASTGSHQLVIEATGFSWIKIIEDRKPPVEILLRPGEKIERSASESFELDIGNAGGTNIVFQGKPLGILGKPGEVVHLKLP